MARCLIDDPTACAIAAAGRACGDFPRLVQLLAVRQTLAGAAHGPGGDAVEEIRLLVVKRGDVRGVRRARLFGSSVNEPSWCDARPRPGSAGTRLRHEAGARRARGRPSQMSTRQAGALDAAQRSRARRPRRSRERPSSKSRRPVTSGSPTPRSRRLSCIRDARAMFVLMPLGVDAHVTPIGERGDPRFRCGALR